MLKNAFILFLALVFFSPGRLTSFDAGVRLEMARALWQTGDVFVPRNETNQHYLVPHPTDSTRGTSFYGIGQTLLFVPFSVLGHLLGKGAVSEMLVVAFLYGPLMGILLWFAMAGLLARLGFSERGRRLACTLILFGTTALIYSVGIAQEEIPIAILLCWAMNFALDYLDSPSPSCAFFSTLFLGGSLLFRANAVFAFLPLTMLALDRAKAKARPDRINVTALWAALAAFVLCLFLFGAFNFWRYGNAFVLGYAKLPPGTIIQRPIQWGLALALWVGPGKGFLTLSPVLLLAIVGFFRGRARFPFFLGGLTVAIVVSSLAYSCLYGAAFPDGSESWGSRFHVHFIFFFAIGLAVFLETEATVLSHAIIALSLLLQFASCWAPDSLDAFGLAGETDSDRRTRLLTHFDDGQLAQRFKTLKYSLTETYPALWIDSPAKKHMVSQYVPNLWGPVYAKRPESAPWGEGARYVWLALLPLALWINRRRA